MHASDREAVRKPVTGVRAEAPRERHGGPRNGHGVGTGSNVLARCSAVRLCQVRHSRSMA